MVDYRHVGFIYVLMHFNRIYFSLSLDCVIDSNGFHRFGPKCEHLCHCVGNKKCDDATGKCKECERPWFGPACQYYDIAINFVDRDTNRRAYGSRQLDNTEPPYFSKLAHDGNITTCSSTDIASAAGRTINPYWSIYFINKTRFYDFQLVLSDNNTLRAYFSGYKIYIENLTSWGYNETERNTVPLNTRHFCYQHNGSELTEQTMNVQCGMPLIGNSVRIEMARRNSQLVLCDIKISAGRNMAFGKKITQMVASTTKSQNGAIDGNTSNADLHHCSWMYDVSRHTKWMEVDLLQQVDINLIVLTEYYQANYLDTGFTIAVSNDARRTFKTIYDNAQYSRPMPGIFLSSKGQHLRIQQMNANPHFVVCKIQVFANCPENYCGYNCTIPCHCLLPGSMQDRLTGVCTSGCVDRWTGKDDMCNRHCNISMWGEECEHLCGHCTNGSSCNVSNGHCKTCAAGYKQTLKCIDAGGQAEHNASGSVIGGSVGVVIIAVGIFISVIYIKRRKVKPIKRRKARSSDVNGTEADQSGMNMGGENNVYINAAAVQQTSTAHDIGDATCMAPGSDYITECDEPSLQYNTEASNRKVNHSISPIAVRELEGYLLEHYNDISFFERTFQEIPSGLQFPTTAAKRSENIGKNRYKGLYAYDHSRVILQAETSANINYINACHIKGYQMRKTYIASQGPMESNMEHFWQMIWEQNVQTVVMVTNLVEETKMKCLQYWGTGLKQQTTYGNFEVTLMKEEVFADFCIRTVVFHRTTHPSERRKLTQFHYTSWPDKDVPKSPISLVHFWRKVKLRDVQRKHPWLVHCSAGIGRTGTFIAMDKLYDQGKATEAVDVAQCVTDLREDRVNMVQTVGQYRFLHRLMLELFVLPFEPVRNELFDNTFREMTRVAHKSKSRKSRIRLQYEDLDKGLEMDSVDDDMACTNALLPENYSKNRFDQILSADEYRPFLRCQVQGRNNYINAVFMPSYANPKGFIISQLPLPSTAVDVCRLILDEEINLVVQFDDSGKEEIGRFLPENEEKMKIDAFEVRRERTYSGQDCQIQTVCLKLNHRTCTFKHILFKKWTRNRLIPPDSSSLLNLVKEVEGQQSPEDEGDSPILVLCLNGAERSGLFVVLMNILERCRMDGEVFIPQVIRYLRSRRQQIVPNLEQYVYCHTVTAKYLESSMTYANLQSAGSDA